MTHQFPHKCSPQYSTIQDFSTFPSGASDGHSQLALLAFHNSSIYLSWVLQIVKSTFLIMNGRITPPP